MGRTHDGRREPIGDGMKKVLLAIFLLGGCESSHRQTAYLGFVTPEMYSDCSSICSGIKLKLDRVYSKVAYAPTRRGEAFCTMYAECQCDSATGDSETFVTPPKWYRSVIKSRPVFSSAVEACSSFVKPEREPE